jgi:O-antigen/teichoic acid export membrane protein
VHWFDPSPAFADSIPVLQIVIWGLPLYAATIVVNRLLITADRQNVFVTIALAAMIANVGLNAFLIPRHGYFGASWATIVAVVISFWLHFHYLAGTQYRMPLARALGGPPVATLAAWLMTVGLVQRARPQWGISWTGLPLESGWLPFLACTGLTAVLYLLAVFALRIVRMRDIRLVKDLLRR